MSIAALSDLGLTAERRELRKTQIGGSDANILMSGEEDRIYRLWQIKRGEADDEDLSDNLAVQMGSYTEPFNRLWFQKVAKLEVYGVGQQLVHADYDFIGCTLDGLVNVDGEPAIFEAKHVGAFNYKLDTIVERYQPQLQHCMAVAGTDKAVLSVLSGNSKHEWIVVEADPFYQAQLLDIEIAFWRAVEGGVAPARTAAVAAPVSAKTLAIKDMSASNEWGAAADDYLRTKTAAQTHDKAKDTLKSLIPADAWKAFGAGIEVERDKRGALRIKEIKQ
jgi:predicted phage-related endonuclease